ncbi:toll/interleukin-1 receptor domain-containing protein [Longimicrobium sp.]|uniref:toll/interleukin-1 receptor domain-containing protein n=1 Tax=Longimicrobium sp. TaxID=2029185 RepID=UPI002E32FED7|nr:Hsp70 family protein [Longimicrobium sp.]HEX6041066.1 Hsp70 family protein [Longimicrobium sp.]
MGTLKPDSIVLSYRREDSIAITGRLHDRLTAQFGPGTVFKDFDSIPLGVNFKSYIDQAISRCSVVIAVIGENWLGSAGGSSRLDDPRDFVRLEIESALQREIPIVPLLVNGARMPPPEALPESLRELAYRNGTVIGYDPHFNDDVRRVIAGLETLLDIAPAAAPVAPAPRPAPPVPPALRTYDGHLLESLVIEVMGDKVANIIPRAHALPVSQMEVFSTAEDQQGSIEIHVLAGDDPAASANRSLGRFHVIGFRAGPRGQPQINVTFSVDRSGKVTVSAVERVTLKKLLAYRPEDT